MLAPPKQQVSSHKTSKQGDQPECWLPAIPKSSNQFHHSFLLMERGLGCVIGGHCSTLPNTQQVTSARYLWSLSWGWRFNFSPKRSVNRKLYNCKEAAEPLAPMKSRIICSQFGIASFPVLVLEKRRLRGGTHRSLQVPEKRLGWSGGEALLLCLEWKDERRWPQVTPGGLQIGCWILDIEKKITERVVRHCN